MKQHFTHNDLLRYIYNEVSYLEKLAIELELQRNEALLTEYMQLCESSAQLDDLLDEELSPSSVCVHNILAYSQSSHLETEFS